jgi:hypothetical protein
MALLMKGLNSYGATANATGGATGLVEYTIQDAYATAIPYGDPVTLSSGYIVACAETATPVGVLRGIRYVDATGRIVTLRNYPASTTNAGTLPGAGLDFNGDVIALVEPVDNRKFLISASDAAVTQADIGSVKRFQTFNSADAFGNSQLVVDMNATYTAGTQLCAARILGIYQHPDNPLSSQTVLEVELIEAVGDAT